MDDPTKRSGDESLRLHFMSYGGGLLIRHQDIGAFVDIVANAQPCEAYWEKNTTYYELKPRESITLTLVPTTAIRYSNDMQTAVKTIREGTSTFNATKDLQAKADSVQEEK